MQLCGCHAGSVFAHEADPLDPRDALPVRAQIQDAEVETTRPASRRDDGVQRVRKVLEQPVLEFHRHSENAIEEFGHVVVVLEEKRKC